LVEVRAKIQVNLSDGDGDGDDRTADDDDPQTWYCTPRLATFPSRISEMIKDSAFDRVPLEPQRFQEERIPTCTLDK
jgi:hypothetical protein